MHPLRVRAGDTVDDIAFTHPASHGLDAVAELLRDPLHRPLTGAQLLAELADQPDRLILL